MLRVCKLAHYMKWSQVVVGLDSAVARAQFGGQRCGIHLPVQNRCLQQFFFGWVMADGRELLSFVLCSSIDLIPRIPRHSIPFLVIFPIAILSQPLTNPVIIPFLFPITQFCVSNSFPTKSNI